MTSQGERGFTTVDNDTPIENQPKDGRCLFIMRNGQRCNGYRVKDSDWCASHDPRYRKAHATGGKKSGKYGRVAPAAKPFSMFELERPQDVREAINAVSVSLLNGEVTPNVASAFGRLMSVILVSLEKGDFESRLRLVEEALQEAKR